jgi:hypothetical protein
MPVNPGTLPGSAIETRIADWDLVHIATAEGDGDDEHAYEPRMSPIIVSGTTSTSNPRSSIDARTA